MTALAHTRTGAGAPLVLLHGIGSSRRAWDPVIPALAGHFDVIAVDLPGFGDSGPLPPEVEPRPAALAAAVAGLLDDLGITAPHVAGNSLGGWVALELAGIRPVASLALLSPAGLWRGSVPLYQRASLRATRWLEPARRRRAVPPGELPAGAGPGPRPDPRPALPPLPRLRPRGHPGHGRLPRLRRHDEGQRPRLPSGPPIGAPVTVAFGSRDHLLVRRSRQLGELPPSTRRAALPHCGHVPMADDPPAVAALITASAARARLAGQAAR